MQASKRIVWVLEDDRVGSTNQAIGVAEALGYPYQTKSLSYSPLVRLPNWIRGKSFCGITSKSISHLKAPWPDIVIAAGRRPASVARSIKSLSKGKSFLVQLMWPGNPTSDFDLIAVPEHDMRHIQPNMIATVGAPHRITNEVLRKASKEWHSQFAGLPSPHIGVLIGGDTKRHRFLDAHAVGLMSDACAMAKQQGGSLLVTTSRRTSESALAAVKEMIAVSGVSCYIFDAHKKAKNPYLGILASSEVLIVTGDSMSMCSEAVATGKPVYLYAPARITQEKHKRLHRQLIQNGAVRPLSPVFEHWAYMPIDVSSVVAKAIKERIRKRT